jgi:hypothetical protein
MYNTGLFFLSFFFPEHGSSHWDVPANAGFLCDKDAMLGDTIKETLCLTFTSSEGERFF